MPRFAHLLHHSCDIHKLKSIAKYLSCIVGFPGRYFCLRQRDQQNAIDLLFCQSVGVEEFLVQVAIGVAKSDGVTPLEAGIFDAADDLGNGR